MRPVTDLERRVAPFKVVSDYQPSGDQPAAIKEIVERMTAGDWTEAVRYIVWANKQHRETPRMARGGAMAAATSERGSGSLRTNSRTRVPTPLASRA